MALSLEETKRLAELARMELGEEELTHLGGDLEKILEFVGRLSAIDTTGVPEADLTAHVQPPADDLAEPVSVETHERIIENFPDRLGEALRVPAVFEHPKS
ncbi:MAG: Asp-tRNA(Asn)/Glu-tRNA(Gln) amidotransferase subunit GatC [Patescibacteria group bacterium]